MSNILSDTAKIVQKSSILPYALLVFLGLLMFFTFLNTIMTLKSPTTINIAEVTDHPTINVAKLRPVADLHLFGKFVNNLNDLPQTLLNLTLQGIAYSADPNTPSRAIIATRNAMPQVYQVGQTLAGGAMIKEIRRDLVVLEDNQQLESLKLPVPKLTGNLYTAATSR